MKKIILTLVFVFASGSFLKANTFDVAGEDCFESAVIAVEMYEGWHDASGCNCSVLTDEFYTEVMNQIVADCWVGNGGSYN
ncbi:hypothetical protein [Tenacibaculum xiamenense]|uniref:hypothetical protein n=1 Tax=Tenacibaculum xiamenense TaxID=1261553 RepID=UPI0038934FB5